MQLTYDLPEKCPRRIMSLLMRLSFPNASHILPIKPLLEQILPPQSPRNIYRFQLEIQKPLNLLFRNFRIETMIMTEKSYCGGLISRQMMYELRVIAWG